MLFEVTDVPLAVKVAVVAPAATVTDAGTVRLALLLETATAAPPLGADPLRVTAQVEVPGVVIVPELHETELTVTG